MTEPTRSLLTVRKVVKLQLNYCNALSGEFTISVLFGGKNAGCSHSYLLIDVYALFLTLVSDGKLQ